MSTFYYRNGINRGKIFNEANIITAYLALKPLYLLSSGAMQIADVFMVMALGFMLIQRRFVLYNISQNTKRVLILFIGLIVFQSSVNLVWSLVLATSLLKSILYYVFNLLAFLLCILIGGDIGLDQLQKAVVNGCVLSCAVSLLGLYVGPYRARSISFFNNPNQLGYHALIIVAFLLLCHKKSGAIKTLFVVGGCSWLIIASASKGAFIALFVMAIIYVLFGQENVSKKNLLFQILFIAVIFGIIYALLYSTDWRIISNQRIRFIRSRILNMGLEDDSNLGSGRGYDRIAEMGVHLFWGMGEGAYYRFNTMTGSEAHSTYASIIVSYGLFGLFAYISFFWRLVKSTWKQSIINLSILSGVLMYSVSHNAIRNTIFWMFLAVMFMKNNWFEYACDEK